MKTKKRRRRISSINKQPKRVFVSLKPKTFRIINKLADMHDTSLSNVAQELIEDALEIKEDIYFSRKAEERAKGKKGIPAEEVWKQLGLE